MVPHRTSCLGDGGSSTDPQRTTFLASADIRLYSRSEYLWDVANRLLERPSRRFDWMVNQTCGFCQERPANHWWIPRHCKEKHYNSTTTGSWKKQQNTLAKSAVMEYSTYLANGWPIASGVIEGAVVILSKTVANFRAVESGGCWNLARYGRGWKRWLG
jgi:hypothetical protein